jgi:predicted phage terminase large subunit-like protein
VSAPFGAIDLQPGPQRAAAESEADIIFYGGAKGGGKSYWGLWESAKFFDLPGHNSIIFRRTIPELTGQGSLWEESFKLYPLLGGEPTESKRRWRFPSGSQVSMHHLQHVADAYAWNGKNIGDVFFDELPFFEEEQFWIILSCQRSSIGGYDARPRVRASMNPDPDSWVLQFVEWYIDEAGYAIPERSGVVRWFGRSNGKLVWFESKADAVAAGIKLPKSFTFIAAKLWDNPALMEARPEYLANLQALPPVEQARYLGGNWKIRAQAGDYFREEWFPIRGSGPLSWQLHGHPPDEDLIKMFRVYDLAGTPWEGDTVEHGTPARNAGDQPDWTRGGLFGLARDGRIVLLDMVGWRDSPGAIEKAMITTALADGPRVTCCVGHDPGQAGIYQIEALEKSLRQHGRVRDFVAVRATKGKEEYAAVASRLAHRGRILVQRAPWNRVLFNELEAFPLDTAKKDQVDVLSQAVAYALATPGSLVGLDSPGISRAQRTMNLDLRTIG